MKQIIQNLKNGETSIIEVPSPKISNGNLLIQTSHTLISPGTEKMLIDFGKANIINKVKQQPEKVKQVINKIKTDGISSTIDAVQNKLNQPITLGYCNVGKVIEVGQGVEGFSIGDRVVSNGNHAEIVSVPKNLCAKIPDNVTNEIASFTVLSAIGLQGIRLAQPSIGEKFAVIGLGAIGLMAVQILIAHGCKVLAVDIEDERLDLASKFGAETINTSKQQDLFKTADYFSNGQGVDGVIITASAKNNEIISNAAKISRKRGRIILVGVTGLNLIRDDFYEKEIAFQVSCSYGPGRYDNEYELEGHDYPIGFVRWTEQRNFEAILDLMSSKKIDPSSLITEKIPFEDSVNTYKKISDGHQGLGMLLEYSHEKNNDTRSTILINTSAKEISNKDSNLTIGLIGAGNHSSRSLIPAFKKAGVNFHTINTTSGLSGTIHGKKNGFKFSSTEISETIHNDEIDTIVVATRHDSHSKIVCQSLEAGKNIFVEKPLAISQNELDEIDRTYKKVIAKNKKITPKMMVGFNRRFSPHIKKMKSLLENIDEPKSFIMTMNAGYIPHNHWVHDHLIGGGRIIGEACHYIDLMRFLSSSKIKSFDAKSIKNNNPRFSKDDIASITLQFEDGSIGVINYFSNGSNEYPKEKIEVFAENKVLSLNNFKNLKGYGWKNFNNYRTWKQNKGQNECVFAFTESIKNNSTLIDINEIFEVSEVSISVSDILRNQL